MDQAESAYIVDQHGRVIAHRDPSLVLSGTSFTVPDTDGIHTGLTGTNVVLAAERVALGGQTLTVVTERPVSWVMALTIRTILTGVALILAAIVAAVALGVLIIKGLNALTRAQRHDKVALAAQGSVYPQTGTQAVERQATAPKIYGRFSVDVKYHLVTRDDHPVRLTPREWAVLQVLVCNAGRVVSPR